MGKTASGKTDKRAISRTTQAKWLPLCSPCFSGWVLLRCPPVTYTQTNRNQHSHSVFPLSTCLTHHYPCEASRQPEPAGRRSGSSIMGNVSRHMSKVQPVSWKSCVWCDSGPPAASSAPPPPPWLHPGDTKASSVGPEGERGQERSQQGGSSALLRWDKCFSSCGLTSLHSYCPQVERGKKKRFCLCVTEKQSVRERFYVCVRL